MEWTIEVKTSEEKLDLHHLAHLFAEIILREMELPPGTSQEALVSNNEDS